VWFDNNSGNANSVHPRQGDAGMDIEDQPDFPRFNSVSTGLKDAEDRMLNALKSGDRSKIAEAKLALMTALDEYRKAVGGIEEE
jgi:hypothetical protein